MLPRHYLPASVFIIGPACLSHLAGRSAMSAAAFGFLCFLLPWVVIDVTEHFAERRGDDAGTLGMLAVVVTFGAGVVLSWLHALGVLP